MKIYITTHFKPGENKAEVEAMCAAVRAAGHEDFSFIRDVENYKKIFDDPKELWERSREELQKCDALLIDLSDSPTGGRVIEAGMAYAWGKPVFVVVHQGLPVKPVYEGIGIEVVHYNDYADITKALARYS